MFACCFRRKKIEPEENIVKKHLSNSNISQESREPGRPTRKTFAELIRPTPVTIARPNNKDEEDITIKKK
jgi:hypothetical protein